MSNRIQNVTRILGATTIALATIGTIGITLDKAADVELAGRAQYFVDSQLEKHTLEGGGDELITRESLANNKELSSIKFSVTRGSTFDDYCVVATSSFNTEGIVIDSQDEIGSTDAISCDDNKTLDFVSGSETIEDNHVGNSSLGVLMGGGLTGVSTLGSMGLARMRRNRFPSLESNSADQGALEESDPSPQMDNEDQLKQHMEKIIMEWTSYEMDPVKVLDYPMVSMMSFAPTSNFHLAMLRAKNGFKNKESIDTLRSLVTDFEHAYTVMIAEAERMKWRRFSAEEQNHLRTAQRLLNIAMNSASSLNERNVAYKRLLKEVEGILTLSPATILEIETKALLPLTQN
ncbi:MAG: hypothetical protein H9W81_05100 [Enterococcus sp.]|nr:hypothetical protein [Enterococcus sp.]